MVVVELIYPSFSIADLLNSCENEPDEALEFTKSRSNVIETTEDLGY